MTVMIMPWKCVEDGSGRSSKFLRGKITVFPSSGYRCAYFTSQKQMHVYFLDLQEQWLTGILLTRAYCFMSVKLFYGNTEPGHAAAEASVTITIFMVRLFCDLTIVYLALRKSVSSLQYIPVPPPVWADRQQGTILALVKWRLFWERSGFCCRSQTECELTLWPKKIKNESHVGVHKL